MNGTVTAVPSAFVNVPSNVEPPKNGSAHFALKYSELSSTSTVSAG